MSATIDRKLIPWLPEGQDLATFIDELAGISVQATMSDGEIKISGTLDAIISAEVSENNNIYIITNLHLPNASAQDSLRSYIQEKEEQESDRATGEKLIVINVPEGMLMDSDDVVIVEAAEDNEELIGEENNEENDTGLNVEGSHTSEASGEGTTLSTTPLLKTTGKIVFSFRFQLRKQQQSQGRRVQVPLHNVLLQEPAGRSIPASRHTARDDEGDSRVRPVRFPHPPRHSAHSPQGLAQRRDSSLSGRMRLHYGRYQPAGQAPKEDQPL